MSEAAYSVSDAAETVGAILEEEEVSQDPLEHIIPLGLLVLLSMTVSFVTFKMQTHVLSTSDHHNVYVMPGLLILLVSGGGLCYVLLASKSHELSAETQNNLERAPTLLGGLFALATWLPEIFSAATE